MRADIHELISDTHQQLLQLCEESLLVLSLYLETAILGLDIRYIITDGLRICSG
jgi:hypothetical protein